MNRWKCWKRVLKKIFIFSELTEDLFSVYNDSNNFILHDTQSRKIKLNWPSPVAAKN